MSIQNFAPATTPYRAPARLAANAAAAAPAPVKAVAPAPAAQPTGGGLSVSGLLDDVKGLAVQAGKFVLSPLLHFAGNYGAKLFVRPGMGSADSGNPAKSGLAYEDLSFNSTDGTPLKGWYIPASAPSEKTVVLAHGHGGQMGDVMWRWAPFLHKAGYNVVCFDFRNSGGSGGDKTTMGFEERRDLDAAITQAQLKGGKHIAVMGLSMGAATALTQAVTDKRIEAVVSDCSFDTIQHAVESRTAKATFDVGPFKGLHIPFTKWSSEAVVKASERMTGHTEGSQDGSLSSNDPIHAMSKLQDRPVFLIHGQADDDTLPGNTVNLAKADPNAELWLVPGAKHGESYQTDKKTYQAKVLDFLKRSF
jgi:pimeloyl-ACP methyl ester carboxylesterase